MGFQVGDRVRIKPTLKLDDFGAYPRIQAARTIGEVYEVFDTSQRYKVRFPGIVSISWTADELELVAPPLADGDAVQRIRALVDEALESHEDSGRGYCNFCGGEDFPATRDGERIALVEDGYASEPEQFLTEHEEWCPSLLMPTLLAHITAVEAQRDAANRQLLNVADTLSRTDKSNAVLVTMALGDILTYIREHDEEQGLLALWHKDAPAP